MTSERIRLADVRAGDVLWECADGMNAQLRARSDAVITGDQVEVEAVGVDDGETVRLMLNTRFPAYGPRIYTTPQYTERKRGGQ